MIDPGYEGFSAARVALLGSDEDPVSRGVDRPSDQIMTYQADGTPQEDALPSAHAEDASRRRRPRRSRPEARPDVRGRPRSGGGTTARQTGSEKAICDIHLTLCVPGAEGTIFREHAAKVDSAVV